MNDSINRIHGSQERIMSSRAIGALALAAAMAGLSTGAVAQQVRDGNQTSSRFGLSVASGDVNDDGYADVLVGAPGFDNGEEQEGKVFLYFGTSTGLATSPAWAYESNQAGAALGAAVAVGDVDDDDRADVIVGVPGWDGGQADEGRVLVFLGGALAPAFTPSWSYEPNQAGARLGASVGWAAKVDNDKYGEVLVGVPGWDGGQTDEGRVLLFDGSGSGLPSSPTWSYELNQAGAQLGVSVASAGDVNGDGKTDVAAGSELYTSGSLANAGRVVVFHGSNSGLPSSPSWTKDGASAAAFLGFVASAGDVNGDGKGDLLAASWCHVPSGVTSTGRVFVYHGSSSGLASSPAQTLLAPQTNDDFSRGVASAGFFNGDAYSDVVIGAPLYDGTLGAEGRMAIHLGSSSGVASSATTTHLGGGLHAQLGHSACSGDVNGDGKDDVIVGAPWFSNGQPEEGAVLLFLGS